MTAKPSQARATHWVRGRIYRAVLACQLVQLHDHIRRRAGQTAHRWRKTKPGKGYALGGGADLSR